MHKEVICYLEEPHTLQANLNRYNPMHSIRTMM